MAENKLSMKYFMRQELLTDEIVEVPGVETFPGEDGNPLPLKIKILGMEEINKIRKAYTKNRIVLDQNGKRVFDKSGKPLLESEVDNITATNRMIVDALVFPDLRDPDLMAFYKCNDVVDMPFKVFKRNRDYQYVSGQVTEALGIKADDEITDDELVDEAKN